DRPPAVDLSPAEPASFARRFLAGFVGWVIFGVVDASIGSSEPAAAIAAYPLCVAVLQVVPCAIWGRTPGQLSTGLRVLRVDTGGRPGWLRSAMRSVVFQSVPVVGLIYFIVWAINVRSGIGRGLPARLIWDRASGTAVVRMPRPAPAAQ